jgi:DNA-binding PadR family transcriptional regulator
MAGHPMGPAQRLALMALADLDHRETPPTPREISDFISRKMRWTWRQPAAEAEAMAGTLRRLERRGLVERLGVALSGARCWTLTDEGRSVVASFEALPTEEPTDG